MSSFLFILLDSNTSVISRFTPGDWITIGIFVLGLIGSIWIFYGKIMYKSGTIDTTLSNVSESLREIKEQVTVLPEMAVKVDVLWNDVDNIKDIINKKNVKAIGWADNKSPLQLTKSGQEVADELKSQKAINEKWDFIKTDIEKSIADLKDSNPYTIQQICFSIGEKYSSYISEEAMNHIKNYAYSKGHNLYEYDIIFGIQIRDRYFGENNIKVEEINDPDDTNSKAS